jgi:tetratricopeptide (TPR) repeat protein
MLAHAEDKKTVEGQEDPTSLGLLKEAERLWKEGNLLARDGKLQDALTKFLASLRLIPEDPKNNHARALLSFYIGRIYQLLKKPLLARDAYRRYLLLAADKKHHQRVNAWLKELYPLLRAKINLETLPAASCTLEHPAGRWTGRSPISLDVEAGSLFIRCLAKDHLPEEIRLTLTPQQEQNLRLAMRPKPKPKLPPPPPDRRWIGYTLLGIGIASLAAAGGLGLSAKMLDDDARETIALRTPEASQRAFLNHETAQQHALAANILYIAGGVLATTGILTALLLWPRPASPLPPPPASPSSSLLLDTNR